jgi:hypothetical protein
VAEGGGLLNRYRVVKPYRGFESLRLRQTYPSKLLHQRFISIRHCRQNGRYRHPASAKESYSLNSVAPLATTLSNVATPGVRSRTLSSFATIQIASLIAGTNAQRKL